MGLLTFDWDRERIKLDETIQEFFNEFDRIERLKSQAACAKGETKQVKPECAERSNKHEEFRLNDLESWEFYVQKKSMITWKREEEPGHYAYKGIHDENIIKSLTKS